MTSSKSLVQAWKEVRAHRINGYMEPRVGVSMLSQEHAENGLKQLPIECNSTRRQICFGQVVGGSTMRWDYIAVEPIK